MANNNMNIEPIADSKKNLFQKLHIKNAGVVVAFLVFVLVFVFFSLQAPRFLSSVNIIKNLLMPASIAIVISLGMTAVMSAGGIDLSISSIAGLAGLASAVIAALFDLPFIFMLLAGLIVGGLVGALNGALVAYGGISPFVVTLSTVFLVQGFQYLIALGAVSGTYLMLPREMVRLGGQSWFIIGLSLLLSVILYIYLEHTKFGRYTKSVGKNIEASRFSGIPIRFYYWLTFVISGLYCAVGGIMLTFSEGIARVGSGESYLIDAFLMPILGKSIFGKFSAQGTIFGAVFMYMIINGLFILGTPPENIRLIKGGLLLAIILASGIQKVVRGESSE